MTGAQKDQLVEMVVGALKQNTPGLDGAIRQAESSSDFYQLRAATIEALKAIREHLQEFRP